MKRVLFTFFICLVIQPLTAQNSISFKNIEAFELGDDPDKFSCAVVGRLLPSNVSFQRHACKPKDVDATKAFFLNFNKNQQWYRANRMPVPELPKAAAPCQQ